MAITPGLLEFTQIGYHEYCQVFNMLTASSLQRHGLLQARYSSRIPLVSDHDSWLTRITLAYRFRRK